MHSSLPILPTNTRAQVLEYLQAQFPQCDIPKMVSKEEATRFSSTSGGLFPKPQFCTDLVKLFPGKGGVALVGDAIHAFPP